jgi:hypothetical protein
MPSNSKKRRFKSFFTKKEKDYNLSYTKREQPILDELAKLPEGSKLEVALRARLDAAKAKAAGQDSPRKDMVQLLRDAEKASAAVAAVAPEMVSSSAIQTAEMIEKMDVGAGEKLVRLHSSAIAKTYLPARTDLAGLEKAVKQQDLSIESVSLDLGKKLKLTERGDFDYAANAVMAIGRELDRQYDAGDFDWPSHQKALDSLGLDIAAHMVFVRKNVSDLKIEIADTLANPAALKGLAEGALEAEQYAEDKIAFDKVLGEVDALVMVLEDWDHPNASVYRDGVNIQSATPPSDYALETTVLAGTKKELAVHIKMTKDAYNKKAAAVVEKLKRVKALLNLLMINSTLDGTGGGYVEAMRDQCLDEYEAIKVMIGSGANESALDGADKLLDEMEKRVLGFDENFDAVSNVGFYEWDCQSVLSRKDYGKMCPEMQKQLQDKLDALIPASGKMDASVAINKFKDLSNEISGGQADSYASTARARLDWIKDFIKRVKVADGELAKMLKAMTSLMPSKDNADFFKKYQGPLASTLAEARTLAAKESQASMDLADAKLKEVMDKSAEAISAMGKPDASRSEEEKELCMDMVTGQSTAVLDAAQKVKDMATFKVEYQQHKNRIDIAALQIENKPHLSGELNAITQLLKNAKELMENTHNLEQARAIMKAADDRRKKLIADAQRPPTELATIAEDWYTATGRMQKAFKDLQSKAIAAVAAADDDALTAAAGTIEAKMEAAAKYLTDEKFLDEKNFYLKASLQPADLRRQREKTLNKIKLLRDYLSNDPVLRSAQVNPFGVSSVIGPVFMTLRDIEHKVMVSG